MLKLSIVTPDLIRGLTGVSVRCRIKPGMKEPKEGEL